ncbi:MAG: DUF262 domain-containing protein [Pseudomonadota bacterium]
MPTEDNGVSPNDEETVDFVDLPSEDEVDIDEQSRFREAVLHATDWTTETIVSQLRRGNIILNPSFQRRDAWKVPQKSRFIESLILGLPIPQIVLAESKDRRGNFIVLDGKQRLLSILQFWGLGEGRNNQYALSGLAIRKDLGRKKLSHLESELELEDDLNALLNQPIRTVVIKNWPSVDFLHIVFLRLNTGSVKLSPQELRQALFPGPFSDWVDDAAVNSQAIKALLNLRDPDYRMRDIEVLSRYLAFRFFLEDYRGRMKRFLDFSFETFNKDWQQWEPRLHTALKDFESATDTLAQIFDSSVGKKPGSKQFNRAVFDFLVFYAQDEQIRAAMAANPAGVREAFENIFTDAGFRSATERDTAGIPNTVERLSKWGLSLSTVIGRDLPIPTVVEDGEEQRLAFPGF